MPTSTIDKQIATDDDDAYSSLDYSMWCPGEKILRIGNSSICDKCNAYGRFTGIAGLAGTIITAAYIELKLSEEEGAVSYVIAAEDAESPTQIVSLIDHRDRPRTLAKVDWDGPWTAGWHQSPSLVSIIQELADKYNPSAIQIFIENASEVEGNCNDWFAHEWGVGGDAMILHIEYIPAAAGGSRGYVIGS